MRYYHLAVAFGVLAGCANSSPAPVGKDTYMVANTGAWSWSSGEGLEGDLLREADAFCRSQGKQPMPVSMNTKDGSFSQFGHASLQFRCLSEGDPDLQRPNLRSVPSMVIEDQRR